MRINKWTVGLAAAGLVSLPAVMQAEEKMNQVWTALSSTTISGYVDTSAHWNPGTGTLVPGYSLNNGKQDGFNLDVVKLTIERPLDEAQWAAGYKVDLLFGPDANIFDTQSINASGASDFGIKQAYVAVRAPVGNGLDFKVGVFDTIIGYEVFESGHNPNYTRSYGYTIEPTTHTGVLMTYQFADWFSAAAGIANTVGPSINTKAHLTNLGPSAGQTYYAESYKSYMGSIALTAPEDMGFMAGSTLYAGVVNGYNENATDIPGATVGASQTSWYAGATMATPIEGLRLGASYDYRGVSSKSYAGPDRPSSYANATALYASMQLSEKLSLHGRGEWFTKSNDASSVDGLPDKVLALTATAQYDLWKNVISRVEFRWDHQADGLPDAYGNIKGAGTATPADDTGSLRNAYLVAANLIYTF